MRRAPVKEVDLLKCRIAFMDDKRDYLYTVVFPSIFLLILLERYREEMNYNYLLHPRKLKRSKNNTVLSESSKFWIGLR